MVPDPFIRQAVEVLKENQKMHMMIRIDQIKCFVVAVINPYCRNL
jgi:hypothetical protein